MCFKRGNCMARALYLNTAVIKIYGNAFENIEKKHDPSRTYNTNQDRPKKN